MEIRLLEYFLAVSKELHYTRAAEKLGITQPTLSQQMRLLESRLDVKLFQQKGKKIYMTDAGKVLQNRAARVFHELEQAKKEISEINQLQRGKLTIGCSGNLLLHSSIMSFHEQYPHIELSVEDLTTEATVEKLLNSTLDLGVVFLPINDDRIESLPMFSTELCLICPKDHALASAPSISLKDLQQEQLFLLQKDYYIRRMLDYYCKEHGIPLVPIVELSDIFSLLEMTVNNHGITILPRTYVEQTKNQKVEIIPIKDPLPKKEIGIVYQKNSFIPSAGRAFIDNLLDSYKTAKSLS